MPNQPELMPWHKTYMIEPEYTRVDLVKEGANSEAFIKILKSKEGGTPMNFEEILKSLKAEHQAIVIAHLDSIKKSADEVVAKAKTDAQEAIAKAKEEVAPVAGATEEEILKSVKDPAVKALLEQSIAKTKAAESVAKALKEQHDDAEAVSKAKEVPNLGADEVIMAGVYKKLKNTDPALCEEVFGIFKAASEMVSAGPVFTEVGKSASSAGSSIGAGDEAAAWTMIEKAAEEIKKTKDITKEAAIGEAIKANPALYNSYLASQR